MKKRTRRAVLSAAAALLIMLNTPGAGAQTAGITLDGVRDPGYLLLAQDPNGDLAAPFSSSTASSWADLSDLSVATDTSTLWVYVDLPNYTSNSAGEFGLAVDTDGTAASGGTPDPWGNAITFAYTSTRNNVNATPLITTSTLLPDVVIRGQLFSFSGPGAGSTELRHWVPVSNTWDGAGVNWGGVVTNSVGTHVAFSYGQGIEFSIPFADLGVVPTSTLHLEFYATGKRVVGQNPGAWDTVPADDQSQSLIQPTTQRRLATFDPSTPPIEPLVSFSAAGYSTSEALGTAPITITVAPTSTLSISVTFATTNGTAGPADYIPISQTMAITAGQASLVVPLQVLTDTIAEPDETVFLNLSQPVYAQLGQLFTATLTIRDSPPVLDNRNLFLPLLRQLPD
jgi:hypothetical protein